VRVAQAFVRIDADGLEEVAVRDDQLERRASVFVAAERLA
jgi:hypothetical protein